MNERIEELERQLQARDKTILVLSENLEQHIADNISGFALFEQNIVLENVVTRRTHELEAQRGSLEQALVDLKRTQAELLQAQKLQAIGQLAGGIAHEINTPTQYIGNNLGFLDDIFRELLQAMGAMQRLLAGDAAFQPADEIGRVLRDSLESIDFDFMRDEIPRALVECADGVKRISGIIGAMKDFAHPSGGLQQPVDLNRLILSTIEISRNEWKTVADLETDLDPGLPAVNGLKDELGQVFLNLIVNAAHAIADRQVSQPAPGRIQITSRCASDHIEILVEDNGCGIPQELQQKIFEPFFTTKAIGRGTGQGLAIAYNVVTGKHQGQLLVTSDPGSGTTFTVRLTLGSEQV